MATEKFNEDQVLNMNNKNITKKKKTVRSEEIRKDTTAEDEKFGLLC